MLWFYGVFKEDLRNKTKQNCWEIKIRLKDKKSFAKIQEDQRRQWSKYSEIVLNIWWDIIFEYNQSQYPCTKWRSKLFTKLKILSKQHKHKGFDNVLVAL
jgi:hypothetical protein